MGRYAALCLHSGLYTNAHSRNSKVDQHRLQVPYILGSPDPKQQPVSRHHRFPEYRGEHVPLRGPSHLDESKSPTYPLFRSAEAEAKKNKKSSAKVEEVKEDVSEVVDEVKEDASDVTEDVKEEAADVAQEIADNIEKIEE